MHWAQFLKVFIADPKSTGAIAPSPESLSKLIVNCARLEDAKVVVELGSGTGIFTERISKIISDEARLIAVEINEEFVKATRARCPDVEIVRGSASDLRQHLHHFGVQKCDRVVSGLPWAVFDPELQDNILKEIAAVLEPGGRFVTFAYIHGVWLPAGRRFKKALERRFRRVEVSRVVWANLPPAFVYCADA